MTNDLSQSNPTTNTSFFQELQAQCKIAIPTIIGLVLYKLPWMISLHFVGDLGPEPLAAAALATTLCNVTGLSFSVGLSSAITTLAGQSRGHLLKRASLMKQGENDCEQQQEKQQQTKESVNKMIILEQEENKIESTPLLSSTSTEENSTFNTTSFYDTEQNDIDQHSDSVNESKNIYTTISEPPLLPLVFLYRGIMVQLLIVVPIGLWWIKGIKPLLLYLGQAEHLSSMTEIYLRILTPGLWSYSINWTVTAWLQSIELADVPAYAALVGFLLHVPFNILYVKVLGLGYDGVALATVSFQIIQPILIFTYLFGTSSGRNRILTNTGARAIGNDRLTFWPEFSAAVFSLSGIKQYLVSCSSFCLSLTSGLYLY